MSSGLDGLVLTGVTKRNEIERFPYQPTYVLESIGDMQIVITWRAGVCYGNTHRYAQTGQHRRASSSSIGRNNRRHCRTDDVLCEVEDRQGDDGSAQHRRRHAAGDASPPATRCP